MSQETVDPRFDDPANHEGTYPPDWDARRRRTYEWDDYTCQRCGRESGPHDPGDGVRLHAHHVRPLSHGGSNRLGNLTTLCEPCHNAVHDHDITQGMDAGRHGGGRSGRDHGRERGTETGTGTGGGWWDGAVLVLLFGYPFYMMAVATVLSTLSLYPVALFRFEVAVPIVVVYGAVTFFEPYRTLRAALAWGVVYLVWVRLVLPQPPGLVVTLAVAYVGPPALLSAVAWAGMRAD